MRSTSNGKTTFAFKLKMLGAEPSYPVLSLAEFRGRGALGRRPGDHFEPAAPECGKGIQRKLAFFGSRGDPLKKRTLTHGCAPLLLPTACGIPATITGYGLQKAPQEGKGWLCAHSGSRLSEVR
jgi:hypothetical protein